MQSSTIWKILQGVINLFSKELEVLKSAILQEVAGMEFYLLAAEKATDAEVKAVFQFLAQEEKNHSVTLKDTYNKLLKEQALSEPIKDGEAIFPEALALAKWREEGTVVVSALQIGIILEKALGDFYKTAASQTNNAQLKELYITLASWEDTHLNELTRYYDAAQSEWWDQQQFSPS